MKATRSKQNLKNSRCEIIKADFHSLPGEIPAGTIDVIITDPPWGMYKEAGIPLQKFYDEMIECFSCLLKNSGRTIILSAAVNELESAVKKSKAITLNTKTPILVSGKKAVIFSLTMN